MSSQEDLNDTAEVPNTPDLFQPKKKPKVIRVLTVMAYILSVSMAAILLSIYYIFMWEGRPHLGAVSSRHVGFPAYLLHNRTTNIDGPVNDDSVDSNPIREAPRYHIEEPDLLYENITSLYDVGADNNTITESNNFPGNATANQTDGEQKSQTNNTVNHNNDDDVDATTTDVNDRREHNLV